MVVLVLLFVATCFLAYSNGANDNFKGVATLFGSGTTHYKQALLWATATTFAGSVASVFLARALVHRFSGKGLVPDAVAASPDFLLAVALGAGLTVILATLIGFPISTTHSLTGALVGTGVVAVGTQVNFGVLGTAFFLPLLLSPFAALLLAALAYVVFRALRIRLGVTRESSVVLGDLDTPGSNPSEVPALAFSTITPNAAPSMSAVPSTSVYRGNVLGISAQKMLDAAHYVSAGVVSFARGLNDTPKIVALLLAVQGLAMTNGMLAVGVAMALGGLLNARKVAETMSKKITPMNPGQGFTANMITGLLVVFASRFGMPVSTTHVSVGSIFGIGTVTRAANKRVVGEILLSWVLTLPLAAFLAGATYWLLSLA
ncbi:MAG: anion permease [Rhodothermales bacterium]